MRVACGLGLAPRHELLCGQLANRFEQPEPGLVALVDGNDHRARHEPVEEVDDVVACNGIALTDGLRRGQRERTSEDREPSQQRLLRFGQQVVRPVERGAQGPVALDARPSPAGQQTEHVVEAIGDLGGTQRAGPGRGQLDRQRDAVESAADPGDGLGVSGRVERGARLLGPQDEQLRWRDRRRRRSATGPDAFARPRRRAAPERWPAPGPSDTLPRLGWRPPPQHPAGARSCRGSGGHRETGGRRSGSPDRRHREARCRAG